jgi:hypothetical protein
MGGHHRTDLRSMPTSPDTDFFISYRGSVTEWARWINWVLRSAGYSTILMDEFHVGTEWTEQMRSAAERCSRLVPLYSVDYWDSGPCCAEFDAYWKRHLADHTHRFVLPIEIQDCVVPMINSALIAKRIHGLHRDAAYDAVRGVLTGLIPLAASPAGFTDPEPPFPVPSVLQPAADWPETPPPGLRWPLADHEEAREAFAVLVTRSSPHRLLTVTGESETGKTHLTLQFLNNAQRRVPGCVCGRFDFKGAGALQSAFDSFVHQLGAPAPSPSLSLSAQFTAVFRHLDQRRQPALLVFDAFEDGGEVGRWLRESLLTSLHRSPWLRVVVAGKSVPEIHGQPWEEDSRVIRLRPPGAEHWHAWGVENGKSITPDFVREVYNLCDGKASTLTRLFGPL